MLAHTEGGVCHRCAVVDAVNAEIGQWQVVQRLVARFRCVRK